MPAFCFRNNRKIVFPYRVHTKIYPRVNPPFAYGMPPKRIREGKVPDKSGTGEGHKIIQSNEFSFNLTLMIKYFP